MEQKEDYIPKDKIPEFLGEFIIFHGIKIPVYDWLNYKYITVDRILKEENMEVRRVLIALKGVEEFLQEGGAQPVTEEDSRGYQIVKVPVDDAEWYFLKMVNSTLEPTAMQSVTRAGVVGGQINEEGYKIYFLRLPTWLAEKEDLSNEDAVVWSFQGCRKKPNAIYNNKTQEALAKSKNIKEFSEDKREFSKQARQGDVFIRKIADSFDDLMKGLLTKDDGYDPLSYDPEIES